MSLEKMKEISKLISEQNNRMTDAPIFIVQQKRSYVTDASNNDSYPVWLHDNEIIGYENYLSDEALADVDADIDDCEKICMHDVWEFVTACFTEKGCKDFIASNGHNLNEPRIYAAGSYRNEEFRAVRNFLLNLNNAKINFQD